MRWVEEEIEVEKIKQITIDNTLEQFDCEGEERKARGWITDMGTRESFSRREITKSKEKDLFAKKFRLTSS